MSSHYSSLVKAARILRPLIFCLGVLHLNAEDTKSTNSPLARNYRFGVNTHFAQGWDPIAILPVLKPTGIGWIRDEIYPKQITETSPGVYSVEPRTRQWIDLASSQGFKINICFNDGRWTKGSKRPFFYADQAAYVRAAAFIAKEFKGKIQALEVLNEPESFGFREYYEGTWNGKAADGTIEMWIKKYVELLNATAEAVKAVNPEIKVIGLGSLAPSNYRMLQVGISSKVDGIVDHPYSYQQVPEIIIFGSNETVIKRDGFATADAEGSLVSMVEMYRAEMQRTKGPKEIWFTEWGYSTYQEGRGPAISRFHRCGYSQLYSPITERAQTCYILRRFVESLALNIEVSFLYDFKNDGIDRYNSEENFGLVDADLRPKPSYSAVQNLTQITEHLAPSHNIGIKIFPFADDRQDPRPIMWDGTIVMRAPGSIRSYEFTNSNGDIVVAIWSAERAGNEMGPRAADVELITGAPVDHVDIYDPISSQTRKKSTTPLRRGLIIKSLSVPDYPLFIILQKPALSTTPVVESLPPLIDATKPWVFHDGGEVQPGSKGSVKMNKQPEGTQLDLAYHFSSEDGYVAAYSDKLSILDATDVRFSTRVLTTCELLLRVEDASGETFQFTITYDSPGKWRTYRKEITAEMKSNALGGGYNLVFGGDGNKRFDFPLKKITLGILNPKRNMESPHGLAEFRELDVTPAK